MSFEKENTLVSQGVKGEEGWDEGGKDRREKEGWSTWWRCDKRNRWTIGVGQGRREDREWKFFKMFRRGGRGCDRK
jgi:hypothetical protein